VSESKELVLVQLPAPADLEAAFISDEYISNLIADIRQKALSVVGDVNTVKGRGIYISMASTVRASLPPPVQLLLSLRLRAWPVLLPDALTLLHEQCAGVLLLLLSPSLRGRMRHS
jgi:hypothetical protein